MLYVLWLLATGRYELANIPNPGAGWGVLMEQLGEISEESIEREYAKLPLEFDWRGVGVRRVAPVRNQHQAGE